MTDRVLLVPTSLGPVAAIVSEPAGPPRGTLILMQGDGPPGRSGVNSVWTRFARELAELGLLVLRFEYADEGDGTMIRGDILPEPGHKKEVDLVILREVAAWLRERAGVEDLLLAGDCHGGRLAIDLGGEDPHVVGAFVSVPYVRRDWVELNVRRTSVGRLRRILRRIDPFDFHQDVLAALPVMLAKGPVWILTGDQDGDEALQLQRLCRSRGGPRIEVDVVAGMAVHPASSPEAQHEVTRRMLRRIARHLDERERAAIAQLGSSASVPAR